MARQTATQQTPPAPPPTKPPMGNAEPSRSGGKVTVACKLPNGILIRCFEWIERDIPVMGGGVKTVKESMPTGETILIKGNATPHGEAPNVLLAGGYALTPDVDADAWRLWLEQNKNSDLVKNRMIFAHEKQEHAQGQAVEQAKLRSGLEPLNPGVTKVRDAKGEDRTVSADPRMPRGNPNVGATHTDKT